MSGPVTAPTNGKPADQPVEVNAILAAAIIWRRAGYSVIPVRSDGSKAPALAHWKPYQSECVHPEVLGQWFSTKSGNDFGLGVVCGAVSRQLEMMEAEGRAVTEGLVPAMASEMDKAGLSELWGTLSTGYVELTPSGGIHWYYRVDGPARANTKLARRPSTAAELAVKPEEKIKVLIETRGEGGFSIVSPTPGTHHPEFDRPWSRLIGSPETIPTITVEQRDLLYAVMSLFDAMPAAAPPPDLPATPIRQGGKIAGVLSPGDDFSARTVVG
jgi:putative DNA primase/helicase